MLSKPAGNGKPARFRGTPGYLGKRGDLVFLGSVSPPWGPARDPRYRGSVLTREQKLRWAKAYSFARPVPLCIDHAGGSGAGFEVPDDKVIGFVTGVLVDRHDDALVTGYVDSSRPEARRIIADMQLHGRKWGLSAYTRFRYEDERRIAIAPDSKLVTHVGVTLSPAFADEGSWIFEFSTNPDAIARLVREREVQANGCVANAELLQACGVAPNVTQHVVSILDQNIALPGARPTHAALPPPPDYSRTTAPAMASNTPAPSAPGTANPAPEKQAPAGAGSPAAAAAKPSDPMEGVVPTGEARQALIEKITAALHQAKAEVAKQPALQRHAAIADVLGKVDAALAGEKLSKADMGDEFGIAYYGLKNDLHALHEAWATDLQKLGGADNEFNKTLVEKMRSNGTSLEERRGLGAYVEATKAATETSQKAFEAELKKRQEEADAAQRSYKEQLELKRKADDENAKLKEEIERLKRTAPLASALGAKSFSFYSPPAGKPQTAPAPSAPLGTAGGAPAFNFLPSGSAQQPPALQEQPRVPADAPSVGQHGALGATERAHTMVLDSGNNVIFNSSDIALRAGAQHQGAEGFVSATGFSAPSSELQIGRDAHNWASTFVLSPDKSAFRQGVRHDNSYDPVFAHWFTTLSSALERNDGFAGLPFNYDQQSFPNPRVQNEAAMFGMSNKDYQRALINNA